MIDPNVELKVKELLSLLEDVNTIWADLQSSDVYVRLETSERPGTKTKILDVKDIKQSVSYFTSEKKDG